MDLDSDKNFSNRYFSMPTLLADGLAEYCKMFFKLNIDIGMASEKLYRNTLKTLCRPLQIMRF